MRLQGVADNRIWQREKPEVGEANPKGKDGMFTQASLGVGVGRFINPAQIVWMEIDPAGKSITLHMSAPGPDGESFVKIEDHKVLLSVSKFLGLVK